VTLLKPRLAAGQFQFEFDSQKDVTHQVEFKNALSDPTWQPLFTLVGDGTRKQVSTSAASSRRFYRVSSQ